MSAVDVGLALLAVQGLFLVSLVVGLLAQWRRGTLGRMGPLQASVFYHNAFLEAYNGDLDAVAGVCRMLLLDSLTTTPDNPDHDFVNDVSADECEDASYGRVTLAGKALTDDDANNRTEWDFNDVVFTALNNETVLGAIAYLQTGGDDSTPTNDALIAMWDIADTASNGTNFPLQTGTEGAIWFN